MKLQLMNKIIAQISKSILLFTLLVFTNSCDDPTEGLNVIIDTNNVYDATLTVQFVNANPQITDAPENVETSFKGDDASNVIDLAGTKDFNIDNGFVGLGVISTDDISEENPLSFTIIADAPGYATTIKQVTISNPEEEGGFLVVEMLDKNNPPEGVNIVTAQISINPSTGATVGDFILLNDATNGKTERASLNIPAGTIFYDENAQIINGISQLTVDFIHFDDQSEASLFSFPGGFIAENVVDTDGSPLEPVQFTTAGLIELEISTSTQKVKQFSQPVKIGIELNENTLNPDTDYNAVSENDTIPVWKLEHGSEDTWSLEGESIVTKNDETGKLEANFEITHLCYYNWDWGWRSSWTWNPTCNFRTNISSNIDANAYSTNWYYIELINNSNNRVITRRWSSLRNTSNLYFWYIRRNTNVKLRVWETGPWWNRGNLIKESEVFNSCNIGQLDVQLALPEPITIDLSARCSGSEDLIIRPSTSILFKPANSSYWRYLGYLKSGKLVSYNSELKVGETYKFAAWYGGQWNMQDITLESKTNTFEVVLPEDYCSGF